MIEVQNLTKQYAGGYTAIRDVSFNVEAGQIVGFLGPNGAGKSTTMRILACFMPATGGTAKVAGYDVFRESMDVRRRIGYLPENVPLYTDMRVAPYLDFVAEIKGVGRSERRRRVADVMDRCHIADMQQRLIGNLSKGYRQRVGLAQALIHDPEVLVLDEPTAGLDPKQITETRDLIRGLAGDHTIVLSTHILPEVAQTCQRVVIINRGKVVAVDSPENLTHQLKGAATLYVQVAGGEDTASVLGTVPGVTKVDVIDTHEAFTGFEIEAEPNRDIRRDVARTVVERGWGLLELRPTRMSLEEVFLQLTTEEQPQEKQHVG